MAREEEADHLRMLRSPCLYLYWDCATPAFSGGGDLQFLPWHEGYASLMPRGWVVWTSRFSYLGVNLL